MTLCHITFTIHLASKILSSRESHTMLRFDTSEVCSLTPAYPEI